MDVSVRPRAIGRIITRASIFLLLGAIVNIAVAWGLSYRLFWRTGEQAALVDQDLIEWWRVHYPGTIADSPAPTCYVLGQFGGRIIWLSDKTLGKDATKTAMQYASGWPLLSMEAYVWSNLVTSRYKWWNAIHWPGGSGSPRVVPLEPLWPAFAINTLFYAAILWLLFALPGALRRWRRLKRGLCPACAYPSGVSPVCTECGKPIPSPLRGRARVMVERPSLSDATNYDASPTLPLPLPAREGGQRPASS